MLKKILGRTVAGAATAGLMLAPVGLIAAPQFTNVACGDYPAGTVTQTDLALSKSVVQYGTRVRATATVSSNVGEPTGKVRFVVNRKNKTTRAMTNGVAVKKLNRKLRANKTHKVKARYVPNCVDYAGSVSTTKNLTVKKAKVKPKPRVLKAKTAKFSSKFIGGGGLNAKSGTAKFTVLKKGKAVTSAKAKVRRGVARVDLKNLKKGSYKLRVKYLGTANFKRGSKTITFRVK